MTRPSLQQVSLAGATLLTGMAFVLVVLQLTADLSFRKAADYEKNYEWDQAMLAYEQAIRRAPWFSEYDESAARLAEKRGVIAMNSSVKKEWFQKSLEFYKSASRKHPYWPAGFFKAGSLLEELKKSDEADYFFKRACVLEPSRDLYLAADAYWNLRHGNIEEALRLFERLQQLPFREMPGLSTLKILEDVYPFEKRPEVLERLLTRGWVDRYTLAQFLSRLGRWDDARPFFQVALQGARKETDFNSYMSSFAGSVAENFIQNGQYADAKKIYDDATKENPLEPGYVQKKVEIERMIVSHAG